MTYAGIDVSKGWLDLALVGPTFERRFRFANNEAGRGNLVQALRQHAPAWVVVEPSGLYHLPLLRLLVTQGFKVALANPYQVASFRRAGGKRNKTDASDALLLAHFALVYRDALVPHRPLPLKLARLKRMVVYREQLNKRVTEIKGALEAAVWAGDERVLAWLREDLAQLKRRLGEVDLEIATLLKQLPEAEVLTSMPGVGMQVAAAVLALTPPELWGRAKAAAAYAGLAPEEEQSGSSVYRSRLSRKGPGVLRKKLYMAALVAVRHDPELGAFYRKLVSRGKKKKQALVAVAHKLLRRMMGRLKAHYQAQQAMVA